MKVGLCSEPTTLDYTTGLTREVKPRRASRAGAMRGPPGDDGGADFDGADLDVLAWKQLPLPRGGDRGRLAPPLRGPPRHCGDAKAEGWPAIRKPDGRRGGGGGGGGG